MNTVVSVIIPTYNGKHKVANLLDSLATQTYDNFEIIVSIDGSSDDTFEYLNTRISAFKNLIVLNEPNGGRAVCRNRGALKAKGELLLFLDDDMEACAISQCDCGWKYF
jgi:glycosyltransferase involved in cell wall biosynthesis